MLNEGEIGESVDIQRVGEKCVVRSGKTKRYIGFTFALHLRGF